MNNNVSNTQTATEFNTFLQLLQDIGSKGEPIVAIRGATIRGTYYAGFGLIDYGGKSDGVLTDSDRSQCQLGDGEEADFYVVGGEDDEIPAQLSYTKARAVAAKNLSWMKLAALVQSQQTVTVQVKNLARRRATTLSLVSL